ncbi:hypothetical protein CJF31_00005055 [Rutstroemia sp. NJR-2017a BVV2]|nr:hypothetical protein CJF31_00005055 [Rutstroemia sp. NJR-2017a BVV2]
MMGRREGESHIGWLCAMMGSEMTEHMGFAVEREMEMEGETGTETEVLGGGELQQRRDEDATLGNMDEEFGAGDESLNVIMGSGNRDEDGDGDGVVVMGSDKLDGGDDVIARVDASSETCADLNLQVTGFEIEDEEGERTEIGNTETAVEGDIDIEGALTANSVPAVDDSTGLPNFDTTIEDIDSTNNFTNSISNDVQSSSVSDEVVMIEAPVDEPNDKEMESYIEPERDIQESVRFLDSIELENLEGLPAPMPSLDSSPTKPLITTQDSSLVDQEPRAEQIEEEPALPRLPKEQANVEIQKAEIPDSDAFTESSVQSPGKADGKMDSSPVLPKYRNAELNDGDGDGGAGQSGRVMSSFGRRCETSDEVDALMVDEGVGAEGAIKVREELGDEITSLPVTDDLAIAIKLPLEDVEAVERLKNSVVGLLSEDTPESPSEASGVDEEVSTSPTLKKVKKRGRPPGRKSSGVIINREEDHEPAAKKTKTDEVVPDPPMREVDGGDEIPVIEKRKRGLAGRKVSRVSVDNSEDDDVSDGVDATSMKETLAVESVSTAGETPNTTSTGEELVNEERSNGQRKILRLAVDDSEDDEEEIQSPVKIAPTKVAEPTFLSGSFENRKSATETVETSLVDKAALDQSPVQEKKKRGRPAGSKASTLSARKGTGDGNLVGEDSMVIDTPSTGAGEETQQSITDRERDNEATANEHSTPSAEKKKRGRPAKRKASTLSTNGQENIEAEPALATTSDESAIVETTDVVDKALKSVNESSPTLSRRGRPPGRKISKLSQNREDGVDDTTLPDPGIINDTSLDSHISPPEKTKRGRPAGRKVSGIIAETDTPSEDTHQDIDELTAETVEKDKSLNYVSPDKKRRGRPPVKKDQLPGNKQVHTSLEQNSAVSISEEGARNEDGNAVVNMEGSLEGEPPLEVKKKRGRPSGSVTKGKEALRATESEENEDTISPVKNTASGTPNIQAAEKVGSSISSKVPGTPSISRSESPPASQNKEILFAELKAIKISSLQTRISTLETELLAQRQRLADAKQELRAPADETVKRHIRLLHQYNDIKDVGQGLLGMVAENRGVRIGELYADGEFGVGRGD